VNKTKENTVLSTEDFKLLTWRPEVKSNHLEWGEIARIWLRIEEIDPIPVFQPLAYPLEVTLDFKDHNLYRHAEYLRDACYAKFAFQGRPVEFNRISRWPFPLPSPSVRRLWKFVCVEWYLTLAWEFASWHAHLAAALNLDDAGIREYLASRVPNFRIFNYTPDNTSINLHNLDLVNRWLIIRNLDREDRDVTTAILTLSGVFELDEFLEDLKRVWPLRVDLV
jgi:hypothetical protein